MQISNRFPFMKPTFVFRRITSLFAFESHCRNVSYNTHTHVIRCIAINTNPIHLLPGPTTANAVLLYANK